MSNAPTSADAFARVSAALLAVWPNVTDPVAGLTRAEVGRVLDECGSDYRPLVDLLLELGRVVRPVLVPLSPQSPATWVHVRAPLVHKLVSTRYLQPDVARWAVDVWGRALGVAPGTLATSPALESAHELAIDPTGSAHGGHTARSAHAAAAPTRASTAPRGAGSTTRPPVLSPHQVPAALKNVPSWAGGPVSFGVGQKPKSSTLAALAQSGRVVVRGPIAGGPRFQQAERRAAMVLGGLLIVISGGLLNAFRHRPDVTTPVDAVQAGLGSLVSVNGSGAGVGATGVGTTGVGTTGVGTAGIPSVDVMPVPARGTSARGMAALPVGVTVREAGVAGQYLVTQRVRDVSGSESCDAVAEALAAGRESQETVSHAPGSPTFTLVTRGVTGTLDRDGQFYSEPRAGTTNNVNWQFRMRGRFGPDGFTGESVTHTDAILRWGKIQTCVVTAELTGRRLLN